MPRRLRIGDFEYAGDPRLRVAWSDFLLLDGKFVAVASSSALLMPLISRSSSTGEEVVSFAVGDMASALDFPKESRKKRKNR
jgi:hypothetical protein